MNIWTASRPNSIWIRPAESSERHGLDAGQDLHFVPQRPLRRPGCQGGGHTRRAARAGGHVVGGVGIVGQQHFEALCSAARAVAARHISESTPHRARRRAPRSLSRVCKAVSRKPSSSVLNSTCSPRAGGKYSCQPALCGASGLPSAPSFCRKITGTPAWRARPSKRAMLCCKARWPGTASAPSMKAHCTSTSSKASALATFISGSPVRGRNAEHSAMPYPKTDYQNAWEGL